MESYDDAMAEFLADKVNIRLALEIAERIEEVRNTLDRTFWVRVEPKVRQKLTSSEDWRICLHKDKTGKEIDMFGGLAIFPEYPSRLYLHPCIANLDLWYGIAWSQVMKRPYPLPEATKLYDTLQDDGYQSENWWIGYKP